MIKHNLNDLKLCNVCLTNNKLYNTNQCRLPINSNNVSPQTKCCNCIHRKKHKNSFYFNLPPSVSDDLNNVSLLINKTQEKNCIENIQDQQPIQNNEKIIKKEKKSQSVILSSQKKLSLAANEIEHLGTTIITLPPLESSSNENDKRCLKRLSSKLNSTIDQNFFLQSNNSVEDLRRRTFSLGSGSWIA